MSTFAFSVDKIKGCEFEATIAGQMLMSSPGERLLFRAQEDSNGSTHLSTGERLQALQVHIEIRRTSATENVALVAEQRNTLAADGETPLPKNRMRYYEPQPASEHHPALNAAIQITLEAPAQTFDRLVMMALEGFVPRVVVSPFSSDALK